MSRRAMQALNQEQHGLRPVDACLIGAWPGTQSKIKMSRKHSWEMRGRERIICIACQLIDKNLKGDMCLSVFPVWKRRAKVDVCCKGWCECSWNWSCGLNKRRQLVRIMVPICQVTHIISERTKNFSRSFDCWKFVARDTFYPNLASGYHCYRDLVTVHQKLFSQALT